MSGVEVSNKIKDNTHEKVALQLLKADGSEFNPKVRYPATGGATNQVAITKDTKVIVRSYIAKDLTFPAYEGTEKTKPSCYFEPTLKRIK